jgi:hypothetical protein
MQVHGVDVALCVSLFRGSKKCSDDLNMTLLTEQRSIGLFHGRLHKISRTSPSLKVFAPCR